MAGVDERQNCLCWWSWRERPTHRNPGWTFFCDSSECISESNRYWALPFGPGCSGLRFRSVRQAGLLRTLHIPNA